VGSNLANLTTDTGCGWRYVRKLCGGMKVDAEMVGSGMWSWIGLKFGSSMLGGVMCSGDSVGGVITSFGAGYWKGSITLRGGEGMVRGCGDAMVLLLLELRAE
jgi:hypothetical protein